MVWANTNAPNHFLELWQANRKRAANYGPLYRSWYGNFPVVHLLKPEHIEVMKNRFVKKCNYY